VLFAGYGAYHYSTRAVSLNPAARDAVRSWVALELSDDSLASRHLAPPLDSAAAADVLRRSDVEIRSITARGFSDNVVARIEIAVHGGPPPDGRALRYVRLLHGSLTGWRAVGETTRLRYYTWLW